MDLDVIDMLCLNAVLQRNRDSISGQLTEVRRMTIETADAARRKYGVIGNDCICLSILVPDDSAAANAMILCERAVRQCVLSDLHGQRLLSALAVFIFRCENIDHCRIFLHRDIRTLLRLLEQMARDLLTRDVLMEEDALVAVCALAGKCKRAVVRLCELDAISDQVADHVL